MRAQKIFIEIGLHCIKFTDWADDSLKTYYNDCLDLIFHRAELDLNQIGFTDQGLFSNQEIVNTKTKLASDYQYLLYRTLQMCI